jgi:DNA-binding CsgD family transcriptional regulator
VAYDVDLPREDGLKAYDQIQRDHSQSPFMEAGRQYLEVSKTGIAVWDPSERTVTVGIHRHVPHEKPFTLRDVRVLELIRPHLLNTIKTIFLSEELAQYKSLAKELTDCPTAIALVRADRVVVFQNQAFADTVHVESGQRLSGELSDLLDKEISKYTPPIKVEDGAIEYSFFTTEKGIFKLNVTLLTNREEGEEKHLLVQLKPAVEPLSRMNHLMQKKMLTRREVEVAILAKDGINDQEIADRLFISFHTAKHHVKSIHKKFDVQTRGQLVAALNQSELP